MTNPIDIANVVIKQKLLTIDGLTEDNVFYSNPTNDLDMYCLFNDISTDLIKSSNYYKELLTVITYHMDVWSKITSEADAEFMSNIVSEIDSVLTGIGIQYIQPVLDTDGQPVLDDNLLPVVKTYTIKSGEKIDLLSGMHMEADDVWLQRGAVYKITMAGSAY